MLQNDLGISVLKSACNSEAKDLAIDWAELGLDALLDEGVLKDAPMLGTVVKTCTISKTIRDRLFVRKVWGFLRNCPKFSEAEKVAFLREYLNEPKKAQRLGDALVLILEKLDDLDKPQMLAKAFAALVRGKIPLEVFRRLAAAIDIGFIEDLIAISQLSGTNRHDDLLPNLLRTGLVEIDELKDRLELAQMGDRLWLSYKVSQLGITFRECMIIA